MRMLNNDVNNISISDQYVSSGLDLAGKSSCIVSCDSFHCRSLSVVSLQCHTSLFRDVILAALLKDVSNAHNSLFAGSILECVTSWTWSYRGPSSRLGVCCRNDDVSIEVCFRSCPVSHEVVRGLFLPLDANEKGLGLFIITNYRWWFISCLRWQLLVASSLAYSTPAHIIVNGAQMALLRKGRERRGCTWLTEELVQSIWNHLKCLNVINEEMLHYHRCRQPLVQ